MRAIGVLSLALAAMATAPDARVSPAQQCVWSCLAGAGGNPSSAGYSQCVATRCAGLESGRPVNPGAGADPSRIWQAGETADGQRYAGIDLPGRAGEAGVYYFCKTGAAPYFALVGFQGGGGLLGFVVDGTAYPLDFAATAGAAPVATIPAGSQLVYALQSGRSLVVADAAGRALFQLSLVGAKQAFANSFTYC